MPSKTFLEYVQLHERTWGTKSYPGKPTLDQFLHSPVVVFWIPTEESKSVKESPRYKATLHKSLSEVEGQLLKMVLRSQIEPPKERMAKIFQDGEPVRVKSISVIFESDGGK